MKITFPHMGTSHIAFKQLLNDMGHEAIIPPKPTQRTLTLGVQNSPEFACVPFKILMGTYLETIELGAEMAITSGGVGPCRAGYYGVLHQKIIDDLGYDFKIIVFDPPKSDLLDFIRKIRSIIKPNRISWRAFYHIVKDAWEKLRTLDEVEMLSHRIRPYEIKKGSTTKVFDKCLNYIEEARTVPQIIEAKEECFKLLKDVPQDKSRNPLKIGIIGEIYVVLEPFANFDIQVTMGEMGVHTERSIWLCAWTRDNAIFKGEIDVRKAAKPYLNELIGGHGINSVGETVLYAKHGFDGVVQLAPFTCIPEIVAKSILPRVSSDLGIPVLTLFIDEQTGKAGVQTRLEAFIDLLQQRRNMAEAKAI